MELARVVPTPTSALPGARISRDDIRSALHTHFHAQTAKQQQLRSATRAGTALNPASLSTGRKRVFSFIQVQKKKLSLGSKRLFGGTTSVSSKSYILCVTVHDGAASAAQLHYLQLQTTFAVDVRHSWDLTTLHGVENHGFSNEKKRGAFALYFQTEETPWQWLVDERETAWAMDEFVWSICALTIDQKKQPMPRLVRFNLDELQEVAIHHNLQKQYAIDVDLLEHVAALKKKALSGVGDEEDLGGDSSMPANSKTTKTASQQEQQRLTAAENEDAAALLATVDWHDDPLQTVEETLKKQLRVLEDENITFLLSFESETVSTTQSTIRSTSGTTSVDRIIGAIDTLQTRVQQVQTWSNESGELLEHTSQNMLQFESLNNQLEIHFKNSVALQETLASMVATIELPRESMGILLKPVSIFPDDTPSTGSRATVAERGVSQAESEAIAQRDLPERLQLTIATIQRVDAAIKSTRAFPASDMAAFRTRGDELARLVKTLCDKLAAAFDAFLQRRAKQWASVSRQAAVAAAASGGSGSSTMARVSVPTSGFHMRDVREASASASQRMSRTTTSFASEADGSGFGGTSKEMDWAFSNEQYHTSLLPYQPLFDSLQSLEPRAVAMMRQLYAKHTASVYGPHVQTLFRCLKEKLPKSKSAGSKHGPHFSKPHALQSWSVHLSASSFDNLQFGAAPLLQQALEHLMPILTQEQHFVSMVFFPAGADQAETDDTNNDALTLLMEGVFDKLLKRLIDFGEACAARNILDALSLVVLVQPLLPTYQQQSAFLYNTMVSFQLQLKRLLIKFTEDQEAWIQGHGHTDTRMAGVLSPIQKTLVMLGRLEECVGDKTDDATLAIMYHRMVPATIQWLDKIAEAKPKYAALTRLENYLFLYEKLTAINATRESPLYQYAAQAQHRYKQNLQLYIASIWSYEFKQLVPLFEGITELLQTLPVHEISFHTSRQDVRRVVEAFTAGFEKSVKAIRDRMKKHFRENANMLPLVWGHLVEYARDRLVQYEKIAADCYQLRLEPTPPRAVDVLNRFASLAPTSSTASMNANSSTHSSCG